jgi:hypothetical protein
MSICNKNLDNKLMQEMIDIGVPCFLEAVCSFESLNKYSIESRIDAIGWDNHQLFALCSDISQQMLKNPSQEWTDFLDRICVSKVLPGLTHIDVVEKMVSDAFVTFIGSNLV